MKQCIRNSCLNIVESFRQGRIADTNENIIVITYRLFLRNNNYLIFIPSPKVKFRDAMAKWLKIESWNRYYFNTSFHSKTIQN